jgi:polyhydroxyalkanoate synthesis regulator phasin
MVTIHTEKEWLAFEAGMFKQIYQDTSNMVETIVKRRMMRSRKGEAYITSVLSELHETYQALQMKKVEFITNRVPEDDLLMKMKTHLQEITPAAQFGLAMMQQKEIERTTGTEPEKIIFELRMLLAEACNVIRKVTGGDNFKAEEIDTLLERVKEMEAKCDG